jgi:hypothetical protein
VWALAVLLVLSAGILLFTDLFGFQLIPGLPLVRLGQQEQFSSSTITLESVRSLTRFDTVRYIYRAVFPYDYLPDGVSLNEIFRKLREATGTVRDSLTPEEYLYFTTYNLASSIGLPASGGAFDFVVVTLVVSAGIELAEMDEPITIEEIAAPDGETSRRAIVRVGPPVINSIAVEDINPAEYPYPDTSLGADAWRRVADYVRSQPLPPEILERVLTTADANAREFITNVLLQAGFNEVQLVTEESEE